MQTDIAGELVREAKTLLEKLRDGIAGTNQEVMAAVDSLRRKGKRIMRLASCRHSSDVYTTATSRRTFEQMPERPSTSSRPSTSARPSASARRSTDGRAAVRSTSVREAPTFPTIPEITQMSERLGGFGPTQGKIRYYTMTKYVPFILKSNLFVRSTTGTGPPHSSAPITSQFQGGFAAFAGNANGPSRASDASSKATYDSSNDARCANLTLARGICTICRSMYIQYHIVTHIRFHYMHLHMAPTHGKDNPLITVVRTTIIIFDNFIDIYIASVGSFRPELMAGFRPYTSSYGDMSSFGGGSSLVPNELRALQTDDAP
uniref:Uncharacterized protein n=1 Tax=Oryza punctata TaxID=4537 RepID=A0A0E0K2F4_ORYPU